MKTKKKNPYSPYLKRNMWYMDQRCYECTKMATYQEIDYPCNFLCNTHAKKAYKEWKEYEGGE